ncbi:MAG TPA: hypothetical protein ENI95_11015 [Chloroflexi bacterium]|nr:hypothetical protein [Chloroflexota bacterium]
MNPGRYLPMALLLVLTLTVPACSQPGAPADEPDVDATVNAAIQATDMADLVMQATIDAAVEATAAALPTPTPPPPPETEEYVTMSEEELAALIEEAVAEATAASEEYSEATQDISSDDTITQEEIVYVYDYYYAVEEAIAYAEELLDAYYYYYGDLSTEAIALLYAVEEDLDTLAANTEAIYSELAAIEATLDQGLAVAVETIDQLEATAMAVQANVDQVQAQISNLTTTVQAEIENRVTQVLNTAPSFVPPDFPSTIQAGFEYLDFTRGALSDDRITRDELNTIAELGANAAAGFSQFGGERSHLANSFSGRDSVTVNLASGHNAEAQHGLNDLEMSLGDRPAPGSGGGPGGSAPGGGGPGGNAPGGGGPGGSAPGGGGPGGDRPGGGPGG